MKRKENLLLKLLAFLLAAVTFTCSALMALCQLANFNAIWADSDYPASDKFTRLLMRDDAEDIYFLATYSLQKLAGSPLSTHAETQIQVLSAALAADKTNLRWQLRSQGNEVLGNFHGDIPLDVHPYRTAFSVTDTDTASADDRELAFQIDLATQGQVELYLTCWVDEELPVADRYQQLFHVLSGWREHRELLLSLDILLAVVCLACTVLLLVGVGHKKGVPGIHLCWAHRFPGDVLTLLAVGGGLLLIWFLVVLLDDWPLSLAPTLRLSALCLFALCALVVGWLATFTARCKGHTLLRSTLLWYLLSWIGRAAYRLCTSVALIWKVAAVSLAYLLLSLVLWSVYSFFWWLALTVLLLAGLCWWAYRWKAVRRGTREIIGGSFNTQIDTRLMPPDLRGHAEELNNLGQAIGAAVEARLRSENFRAELITNVSHDLKTPLTSIINYVDLLKKEELENETAREYLEVLDRKSQRLKKLTEDLVEASKASTGNLALQRERIDLNQLLEQALGEYEDRLRALDLHPLLLLPTPPLFITADGRHLWRIIDNLLSNCCKYTMPGTRVYVEAARQEGKAVLSVKNISREPLNLSAEALMERFVRGDASRTTEGSGLGLSIARSLTDLQGGEFALSVDGDLFKATLTFPEDPGTI